jgi:hypothetical protein
MIVKHTFGLNKRGWDLLKSAVHTRPASGDFAIRLYCMPNGGQNYEHFQESCELRGLDEHTKTMATFEFSFHYARTARGEELPGSRWTADEMKAVAEAWLEGWRCANQRKR